MLIGNAGDRQLLKIPFPISRPIHVKRLDNDKAGGELFDYLTRRATAETADATTLQMMEEIRHRPKSGAPVGAAA